MVARLSGSSRETFGLLDMQPGQACDYLSDIWLNPDRADDRPSDDELLAFLKLRTSQIWWDLTFEHVVQQITAKPSDTHPNIHAETCAHKILNDWQQAVIATWQRQPAEGTPLHAFATSVFPNLFDIPPNGTIDQYCSPPPETTDDCPDTSSKNYIIRSPIEDSHFKSYAQWAKKTFNLLEDNRSLQQKLADEIIKQSVEYKAYKIPSNLALAEVSDHALAHCIIAYAHLAQWARTEKSNPHEASPAVRYVTTKFAPNLDEKLSALSGFETLLQELTKRLPIEDHTSLLYRIVHAIQDGPHKNSRDITHLAKNVALLAEIPPPPALSHDDAKAICSQRCPQFPGNVPL